MRHPRLRAALPAAVVFLVIGACSSSPERPSGTAPDQGAVEDPDTQAGDDADEATRELSFDGPEQDELVSADELTSLEFVVAASSADGGAPETDDLRFHLDGRDVTAQATAGDDELIYAPDRLDDGERLVEVISVPSGDATAAPVSAPAAGRGSRPGDDGEPRDTRETVLHEWSFTVDTQPPPVDVDELDGAVVAGEPVTVSGTSEAGATVTAGGDSVEADEEGSFSLELDSTPDGVLEVAATDAAGNASTVEATFVTVPSRVEVDEIRSVHVSFCAWATPSLRDPVLAMVDDGTINAVQLDLKDETGKVGFDSGIELAAEVGADEPDCRMDLDAAVEQLHDLDVAVIGRIVAFADPVLAPWAWENGRREWVMQNADGQMYTGRYAGFSNFAAPEVVDYNLDVAEQAAAAGVDHILWDYIRKPDGPAENFRFVGLEGEPVDGILEFTRLADERLAPYGVAHGASVYGVSADRPTEVAQAIPAMSEHLDYVAPMLYPSHWAPGEYGISDPLHDPYDTIHTTLDVWKEATEGKRARVVPWLEDSQWPIALGYPDRSRYVREQIRATYDQGIHEWILWDSAVRYTTSAIIQPEE